LSLAELVERKRSRSRLPRKALVITFDDGYANNYEKAFPILKAHGFKATVFLTSGLIGSGRLFDWDKERRDPESYRPLNWDQVLEMAASGLVSFGAHTRTHRWLTELPAAAAEEEIEGSKRDLEQKLGTTVRHFCYPAGRLSDAIVAMVKGAGFEAACVTPSGPGIRETLYTLKRVGIYRDDDLLRFRAKLSGLFRLARESRSLWRAIKSLR
jgi:peptidoglycan/xylan/chitin deacetylase (PgdA/CDA1 family)